MTIEYFKRLRNIRQLVLEEYAPLFDFIKSLWDTTAAEVIEEPQPELTPAVSTQSYITPLERKIINSTDLKIKKPFKKQSISQYLIGLNTNKYIISYNEFIDKKNYSESKKESINKMSKLEDLILNAS